MTDSQHPAEPVAQGSGKKTQGGFAEIARQLNQEFPPGPGKRPISRQHVHKWWKHRHYNGFPPAIEASGGSNGGRGRSIFRIAEVFQWYVPWRRIHGQAEIREESLTPPTALPLENNSGNTGSDALAA